MERDALIEQYACLVDQFAAVCSKIVFNMTRNAVLDRGSRVELGKRGEGIKCWRGGHG
jgi:hypothetical protein